LNAFRRTPRQFFSPCHITPARKIVLISLREMLSCRAKPDDYREELPCWCNIVRAPLVALFAVVSLGVAAAAAEKPAVLSTTGSSAALPKIGIAPDGRTFQAADGRPFVPMGVNYFRPGTGWAPQLWKRFDPEATRQDFARMKELGVNCVRVFLTYGSFFTESSALYAEGLGKFDQFLRMAESAGIYVHPTGPDHWEGIPSWAATDRIADERVLAALENFWRLFAQRYRGRNVIFAYDLLNEPHVAWDSPAMRTRWNRWLQSRYPSAAKAAEAWGVPADAVRWGDQRPPKPQDAPGDPQLLDYQEFREEIADEWTRRQVAAIKSADPEALATVGLIQWSVPAAGGGPQQYAAFRPKRLARLLDFMEVHFYPLAAGFYEYTRPEDETRNLAYLESVVREVAAAGRPVVLAEFGWYGGGKLTINRGVHPAATEEQQAQWCRRAVETTAGLAAGWLNWGLYDHPEARDVTQLTGLLTVDGKPKAWAREFHRLVAGFDGKPLPPASLGPRPALDWDRAITSPKTGQQFRDEYYDAFRKAHASGALPTIHLACGQIVCRPGDVEGNLKQIRALAQQAAVAGARLCLFAEGAVTGYVTTPPVLGAAPTEDGPVAERLKQMAAELKIAIAAGTLERSPRGIHVSCFIALPGGRFLVQRKHMLNDAERKIGFAPGPAERTIFEVDGVKMAVCICADVGIPGVRDTVARRGCQVLLVPTAGGGGREHVYRPADLEDPKRLAGYVKLMDGVCSVSSALGECIGRRMAQVAVNLAGDDGIDHYHPGHSSIIDSRGRIVALHPGEYVIDYLEPRMIHGPVVVQEPRPLMSFGKQNR